jgi:hypothetical protein
LLANVGNFNVDKFWQPVDISTTLDFVVGGAAGDKGKMGNSISLERLAALRGGRIQATLLNPPKIFLAERRGFHVLADVSNLRFENKGVVTTKKFIREPNSIVRSYVKSQLKAVHVLKTDRQTGFKVFVKHRADGRDADPQISEKSCDVSITDDKFPRNQYRSFEGIPIVIEWLGERGKDAKPADFDDASFVRELDQYGFTRDLYTHASSRRLHGIIDNH